MPLAAMESLKIFCDVVRQRSFSAGATLNHVSQSAVSQAISQIEKRLGVRLIDRSTRPFTLTSEGAMYYEECRDLVDRYVALEARLRSNGSQTVSRVRVASIYSLVLYNLYQYVEPFKKLYPEGSVTFDYLHPNEVYENVLNEKADLGLLSCPRTMRQLEMIPWRDEPMALVCPPSHPFARRSGVALKQLQGEEFVAFEAGLAVRSLVDRFLRQHKVDVRVTMAFDNIEAIKRAIENSGGVSILPKPTVQNEVANGSLAVVPLEGLAIARPLAIVYRRKRILTPAILDFISLLRADAGAAVASAAK
ncbi:MAG: LysR family transcriptional regulator [Candidatus Sumerlaeota bacterium]|nr:LysR family transcriptional regulator [Candidatus Sumerlaeota bacterium]